MSQTWNAQCRCASLRVSVSSPPALQLVCHCTDCREVAGTPFSNFVFFRVRDAQVEGEVVRREFVADSGSKTVRESCARCGDMLIDRTEGYPKIIGLVAERIAPPFNFEPQHHVWADSKLPEVVIPAGAKVFARGATG